MGYQPNDFVNPNERGVELPPGCKDLMDVLKKGGVDQPAAGRPVISYGALSEIEQRVGAFLLSGVDRQLLSVGIPKRSIMLILLKRGGDVSLNFSVPAKHQSLKDAVLRIFQNPKFGESICGMEHVSVALNPAKEAMATMMAEVLAEGFGVPEGEQLMFCSYARVEGTADG
jgi:hypothetical protein